MEDTKDIVFSDGTVLNVITCKKCKNHIVQNWAFCPHCGRTIRRRTKDNKES